MAKPQKYVRSLLTVLPLFLGGMILSFVVFISVWSVVSPKSLFQTKIKAQDKSASLSLVPNSGLMKIGQKQSVGVILTTGEKNISGVDLTLKFDPEFLSVGQENIAAGNLLEKVLLKKVADNRVSFSAVTLTPSVKNGILVTLIFTAKKAGKTQIEFVAPFDVLEAETVKNILGKTENGQFDIE